VDNFGEVEVAIGAVRNHRLTRLKTELDAIKIYRDDVRFERHQIRDAADLRIPKRSVSGRQNADWQHFKQPEKFWPNYDPPGYSNELVISLL
jgi:hypothetical protein